MFLDIFGDTPSDSVCHDNKAIRRWGGTGFFQAEIICKKKISVCKKYAELIVVGHCRGVRVGET